MTLFRFKSNVLTSITLLIFASVHLTGCSYYVEPSEADGEQTVTSYSKFDPNMYPMNKLVCDPMSDPNGEVDPGLGLIARLYYLKQGERYYSVPEYLSYGVKSAQKLFFSEVNVPTRKFDTGFPIQTGGVVKNDEGTDLFEYFALQFSSILVLRPEQSEGLYELALLSDDGAIFKVRENNGQYVAYVTNDGDHPTRFGCGSKLIDMKRDSEHVISIEYYQGPRLHISLIPMWRKVDGNATPDPLCGATGNDIFFDYNDNSKPKAKYNELLSRGWEPIQHHNYKIPETAAFNPCTTAAAPIILDFKVDDNFDGGLFVSWSTDAPTTGQVLYKNTTTGNEVITRSDNILRASHVISIPKPLPGHSLEIKAVSITDQLGRIVSDPLTWNN